MRNCGDFCIHFAPTHVDVPRALPQSCIQQLSVSWRISSSFVSQRLSLRLPISLWPFPGQSLASSLAQCPAVPQAVSRSLPLSLSPFPRQFSPSPTRLSPSPARLSPSPACLSTSYIHFGCLMSRRTALIWNSAHGGHVVFAPRSFILVGSG